MKKEWTVLRDEKRIGHLSRKDRLNKQGQDNRPKKKKQVEAGTKKKAAGAKKSAAKTASRPNKPKSTKKASQSTSGQSQLNKQVKQAKMDKNWRFGLALALALLVGIYLAGGVYYQNHFVPGKKYATESIQHMTLDQAINHVNQKIANNQLTLTENKKDFDVRSLKDIGISFKNIDAHLAKEMNKQQSWTWPLAIFRPTEQSIPEDELVVKEKNFKQYFASLPLDNDQRPKTMDAKVVLKNGAFRVAKPVQGTYITEGILKNKLVQAVSSGDKTLALEEAYQKIKRTDDDADLIKLADKYNGYLDATIKFQIAKDEVVVPKEVIAKAISFDGAKITVAEEPINDYTREIGKKYDTIYQTREFKSTNRGVVQVNPGNYGFEIEEKPLRKAIIDHIRKGKSGEIKPEISGIGYHEDGTDIGSDYTEVDLTSQHMWIYKNNELVFETPIVSGKPTALTPTGVYFAWNKSSPAVLKGIDYDTNTRYEQPVNYWIAFDYTGCGFHDSPWQIGYGGNIWSYNGSNGCVNISPEVMARVYELITPNMPVIVHS